MTAPPTPDPPDQEPPDGSSTTRPALAVNGRYLIERELGRGGIGVVYLARDLRLHEMPVVIKFLLDDSTQNPWLAKKFLQEAEALTRIHHPGVVRVIDRDQTPDGRPFFVMEFVKGASLRSAIPRTGLDLEFAAKVVSEVGQALRAAHQEGVLHRDLKPENIMLETVSTGAQHAKLIDFGISKVRDSREAVSTELGTLAGSLNYLAPEQLLGAPASVASDIYAFAVVAYELLTGRRPFNPDAPNTIAAIPQLVTLQRNGHVVPPQQLRPGVSEAAQAIVMRGLAFEPAARLTDASQFGDDLAQALRRGAGERIESAVTLRPEIVLPASTTRPAPPPPPPAAAPTRPPTIEGGSPVAPPPSPRPPHRRRGWLAGVAATLAAAAVVGVVYLASTWSSSTVPAPLQKEPAPAQSRAEVRTLTYSLLLRRDPKRYPDGKPTPLAEEKIFSAGDRVRLAFKSRQGGHLYIFNESPPQAGVRRSMNVLFPSTTSNDGSAALPADRAVMVPDDGDFVFDTEEGVERLWIVWSREAQPRLDAMGRRWANAQHRGEIKDAADVDAVDTFLRDNRLPAPDVAVDELAKVTRLSAQADVFVRLVKLEHH